MSCFVAARARDYGYAFGVKHADVIAGKHPEITEWHPRDPKETPSAIARRLLRTAVPLSAVADVKVNCPHCKQPFNVRIDPE